VLPAVEPAPDTLDEKVALYGAEVAKLRQLDILAPVPAATQTEAELRASLRALFDEEWNEAEDVAERAYKLFGLIPRDMDLREYLVRLYTGQVAGYYDPKTGRFFVAADGLGEEEADDAFVISHEFAHALQDQHFDLDGIDRSLETQADRLMAVQALTEGDAMLAAIDHTLYRLGLPASAVSPLGRAGGRVLGVLSEQLATVGDTPQAEELREAPPVIAAAVVFPYVAGMRFASALRADLGQAGIDAAFRDPPDSTEQILYPERYLERRDRPVAIALASPPEGLSASLDQTLGMQDLRIMLDSLLGDASAAEGWDGDRYALWTGGEGRRGTAGNEEILAWVTAWDREWQAVRFERTYARLLEAKRRDRFWSIARRGDVVAVVEGVDPERARVLVDGLLQDTRTERASDDQPPPTLAERTLRWPAFAERLEQGSRVKLLGGNLLEVRLHDAGHRVTLARGVVLRSEATPDRRSASALGGLVWWGRDAGHGYAAFSVPVALAYHARGEGDARRTQIRIGQTLVLPSLLAIQSDSGATRYSLAGILQIAHGPATERGKRVSLFGRIPIPGL
jgi:hypothetical protein